MSDQLNRPVDLRAARVLISNDDGIDADGLLRLEAVVRPLVREIWVVAPEGGRSAASSMMSLRRTITLSERGERRFAISGSPADCVLMALQWVMKDAPPDIVLSGINHGLNVGIDVNYSGTIGVATVAASNGIPAVALSAQDRDHSVSAEQWDRTVPYLPSVLESVCAAGFGEGSLYNVNLPEAIADPKDPVRVAPQGIARDSFVLDPLADENHFTIRHTGEYGTARRGMDLDWVRKGYIAVTPLGLDRTDAAQIGRMRGSA